MYQLPRLARMSGLVHGISTSEEGNQGFGHGSKGQVIANRGQFIRRVSPAFHIGSGVSMVPFQTGREEIITAISPALAGSGMKAPNSGPQCEALITTFASYERHWRAEAEKNSFPAWFYLFLAIGDCFPLILYAPAKRVLAMVHLSRESSVRRMALRTIEHLEQYFEVNPSQIFAGIGPGIRTYALEWFEGVNEPEWKDFIRIEEKGVLVNLLGFNVYLLKQAGVREENIEVSEVDTFTDTRFASHRRSKATGEPEWRHACAVGMVPMIE